MLKVLYSFFLGMLLAVFVGMGIASFYPRPAAPDYPPTPDNPIVAGLTDEEFVRQRHQAEQEYEKVSRIYNDRINDYDRNVSVVALAAAVVLISLGLMLYAKIDAIADGMLLGGVFMLLYSVERSFAGGDPRHSFMVMAAGLVVTMVVGYVKFVKPRPAKKRAK